MDYLKVIEPPSTPRKTEKQLFFLGELGVLGGFIFRLVFGVAAVRSSNRPLKPAYCFQAAAFRQANSTP
jgi:hypothetical protein